MSELTKFTAMLFRAWTVLRYREGSVSRTRTRTSRTCLRFCRSMRPQWLCSNDRANCWVTGWKLHSNFMVSGLADCKCGGSTTGATGVGVAGDAGVAGAGAAAAGLGITKIFLSSLPPLPPPLPLLPSFLDGSICMSFPLPGSACIPLGGSICMSWPLVGSACMFDGVAAIICVAAAAGAAAPGAAAELAALIHVRLGGTSFSLVSTALRIGNMREKEAAERAPAWHASRNCGIVRSVKRPSSSSSVRESSCLSATSLVMRVESLRDKGARSEIERRRSKTFRPKEITSWSWLFSSGRMVSTSLDRNPCR
mmetsp:Transcript_46022/g.77384  ORF Transcript_46022/g.77384 Transcript_46022/m.77384 type:complete len:310 (+) Transcript_46022:1165-2094(+)